jgi:hypothetical protein
MEQAGTRWFSQALADTQKRGKILKRKNCVKEEVIGGFPSTTHFK